MRLLVVGAAGQVGRATLSEAARHGHEGFGGFASRPPSLPAGHAVPLDKRDPATIAEALRKTEPDMVVDTGALHHVDYCESHPQEAFLVNRDGSQRLAELAAARGTGVVFVSTDFVFDGAKRSPYEESDPPRPMSIYGRSKLEGEAGVLRANPAAWVVRPSVIYSWIPEPERVQSVSQKGVNFGSWVIDELSAARKVRIVTDQVGSPTLADDLAEAIVAIAERRPPAGVYHAAGATALSRFEFTRRLARRLGFDADLIEPVRTADLRQTAPRPADSSLDSHRLAERTGHRMLTISDALDRLAAAYDAG